MDKDLEELVQKRRRLIEAHEENDFTDGIHALLTDLYPDKAHFIYELLQNAEDMKATTVIFRLNSSGVEVEHNGTKRSFNIADIDAITNIGHNSQKKDDPTAIGKFGVGFKAVFAYTATPEIHSGEYHFRIRDYFVPEFENIEIVNVVDENGVSWTKFRFPFNNPNKPADRAYNEVFEGLTKLDDSSILFLQHINFIVYEIDDIGKRMICKEEKEEHIYSVTYFDSEKEEYKSSEWLCFDRPVDIKDDQGNKKTMFTAIAYYLEYNKMANRYSIKPVKDTGKTFIYFPAEKEYSGLRFYINAPFASTVARDSIRYCQENAELMETVSLLVVDSLFYIKESGMLNYEFLGVLPNKEDDISGIFEVIRTAVIDSFHKNEFFPLKDNLYVNTDEVIIGESRIAHLFPDKAEFSSVSGIDKYFYTLSVNQKSNSFINSLDIHEFDHTDFINILTKHSSNFCTILKIKDDEWLLNFYKLALSYCTKKTSSLFFNGLNKNTVSQEILEILRQLPIIKAEDEKIYKSNEILILPSVINVLDNSTVTVKKYFSDNPDALKFFKLLEIKEYGPRIVVEKILSNYAGSLLKVTEKQYFADLLFLARYDSKTYGDVKFSNYYLFKADDDSNTLDKADELYFGSCYDNPDGEILACKLLADTLWNGYIDVYDENELKTFLQFAERCGVKKSLEIVKTDVHDNPCYSKKLTFNHKKETSGLTNKDYSISDIKQLLESKNININRIIWETVYTMKASQYKQAEYSPNASTEKRVCDSTLVYYLKKYAWIPDKEGVLHVPNDITIGEIHDSFILSDSRKFGYSILNCIGIGESASIDANEKKKAEQFAKNHDSTIISNSRLKELEEFEKRYIDEQAQKEKRKKYKATNVRSLFSSQNKKQKESINSGDDFIGTGAVNNKARREKNLTNSFLEKSSSGSSVQRKYFSRIVESNKEEKHTLKNWYNGQCQMCDRYIVGWDDERHFEARNIIITNHLDDEIRNTTGLAWNSLSLCPFCAAKYEVCSRNMDDMPEQILSQEVYDGDDERIVITMELAGERQEISFVPKHFLALQTGIKLLDEYLKKNSEI